MLLKSKRKSVSFFVYSTFTFTECESSVDNTKHQMIQKKFPRLFLAVGGKRKHEREI